MYIHQLTGPGVFSWDLEKSMLNWRKHRVSFEEAATVFDDPLGLEIYDLHHSYFEERWIRLGTSLSSRVIVVAYTKRLEDGEEKIRIISARRASQKEKRSYYDERN